MVSTVLQSPLDDLAYKGSIVVTTCDTKDGKSSGVGATLKVKHISQTSHIFPQTQNQ